MYFSDPVDAENQAVIQASFQKGPGFTNILKSLSLINVNKVLKVWTLSSRFCFISQEKGPFQHLDYLNTWEKFRHQAIFFCKPSCRETAWASASCAPAALPHTHPYVLRWSDTALSCWILICWWNMPGMCRPGMERGLCMANVLQQGSLWEAQSFQL